ncbi:MAG TPA: hypothetical protein VM012_14255 [Flavitalea sp.]|nr:hypothetical protein [Flavitalea sp.]
MKNLASAFNTGILTFRMRFVFLFLLLLSGRQLLSQSTTRWYKGNTHTHSYWSDGDDFPEMIVDWYKAHGYDFIALSDHNILPVGEKWKQITAQPFRQQRFREYLQKFGEPWVTYKTDSGGRILVKLKTLAEYRTLFEEKNKFLLIAAEEITDEYKSKPVHINAFNIKELINPLGGNSIVEVMQNNLDQVYAQRQRTGQPMFPHINHPNFNWSIKVDDMMQLKGERFFEVYNGHPHVHNYGDSVTMGMEELWDRLLIHYIMDGKQLLYGLATDDAHNYLEYQIGMSNPGRGWVMVRASELTAEAIISSMEKGNFYSSTGVELENIIFQNNTLQISVKKMPGINYTIEFWGATKSDVGRKGRLLKTVRGNSGNYRLTNELYVRAKIISSKPKENPYQAGDVETAWTQPVRNAK